MKVTIGGDRVGSGKKMRASLNNYYRSTHNLSGAFASTMQCGLLYPTLVKPVMRGDTFDIKIYQDTRTIPTKQALFGTFKMQTDVYFCPWRLYQGILHNNPLAIGLKMNQVLAPKIVINSAVNGTTDTETQQFNNTSLMKYLGVSGIGRAATNEPAQSTVQREFLAIPALAYYDIFKNYYANKQEEDAYIVGEPQNPYLPLIYRVGQGNNDSLKDEYINDYTGNISFSITNDPDSRVITIYVYKSSTNVDNTEIFIDQVHTTIEEAVTTGKISIAAINEMTIDNIERQQIVLYANSSVTTEIYLNKIDIPTSNITNPNTTLVPFKLQNIDDMRYFLLNNNKLGQKATIQNVIGGTNVWGTSSGTDQTGLPYTQLVKRDGNGRTANAYTLNGLVLKTYQNDIYNNWLNSDWIEGENGINELTNVQVTDGKFSMDALNFAQKLYNMLNRVAISGATYEDWQDVVYEEVKRRQIESPVYLGGCSHEIVFDEIVQTAPTDGNPLGTLGGRGRVADNTQKGGKLHVKIDEAGFIIAITSLTPRIYQSQGNEFYMTEIDSLDDLHKPGMDGIGFQDLIGERMAWWDTIIAPGGSVVYRSKVGKLPAWMDYMTNVDKAYGEFANEYGKSFGMILLRNYERTENGSVKDFTTYIDPAKYNYAFANTEIDAQNFWVKIYFDIKARRLMSARLIPHV